MIPRAFLSHSSKDKELVEEVALELGRQQCVFDKFSFQTGEEFRQAIRRGLKESSLFVLLASEATFNSLWVDWEQQEAEQLKIYAHIKQGLTFIIDNKTPSTKTPTWLRTSRIITQQNPKAIAREIQDTLNTLMRERDGRIFIGRTRDTANLERLLVPYDTPPPRCIAIWGLEGAGRRTLLEQVAKNQLNFKRLLPIVLEDGDELREIVSKLSAQIEQYRTDAELRQALQTIEHENEGQLVERFTRLLRTAVRSGELPTLIDEGDSLSQGRSPRPHLNNILQALTQDLELYLGLILHWRIAFSDSQNTIISTYNIGALEHEDMQRLIATLLTRHGLKVSKSTTQDLAEFVGGYPPAAYFAARAAATHGIDSVLSDKTKLVTFRAEKFSRYLARTITEKQEHLAVAAILAVYSPVPASLIAAALQIPVESVLGHLEFLIDSAIVRPDEVGWYRLASPLLDAVARTSGHLKLDHSRIARALEMLLANPPEHYRLELHRHLFRAQFRANEMGTKNSIKLRSDFVRLFHDSYDSERYEEAISIGKAITELYPNNPDHLEQLGRALVRTEKYEQALEISKTLSSIGAYKEAAFLEGFSLRYQRRYTEALQRFQESLRERRTGIAIHRELANCYFNLKQLEEAKHHVNEVLKREPDNRFMIDIAIQISCAQHDRASADKHLAHLESLSQPPFFLHRKSMTAAAFGESTKALEAARLGVMKAGEDVRFEWLAHLANLEIEAQNIQAATDVLSIIDYRYPERKSDIRLGLRCKLELRKKNFEEALALLGRMRSKDSEINESMRRDALKGSLASTTINITERHKREQELSRLMSKNLKTARTFADELNADAVSESEPAPVEELAQE